MAIHGLSYGKTADDYCEICFIEGLGASPVVQFDCKHIFHLKCVIENVSQKWPGPRIVFNFLNCTSCKQKIKARYCPELHKLIDPMEQLETDIKKMALERAKHEGIDKHERLQNPQFPYYNNLQGYSMAQLCYYQCF